MRFDNPISDHGFSFPDIASFPDVSTEYRYEGSDETGIEMIKKSIKNNDLSLFQNGYRYYMKSPDGKLFSRLDHMFNFYSNFEKNRRDVDVSGNKVYDDLFENGISYLDLDLDELKVLIKPHVNQLLSIPDWRPPPGTYDRIQQLDGTFKGKVQKLFEDSGVIDAASKYNRGGRRLHVANAVLHVAKPTDQNWKQFLYDCNTVTETINMHIDPKEDVIKSMVYLDEVDEETGPFSYIEKSNRWVYDEVQSVFGRAITTGSYCCDKQSRSAVFQLPEFLRVSYNFGRLLLDNTPQQKNLLDQRKQFVSSKGNVCIFDPAGMHQGGICKSKNRIALQVLMK